LDLSRDHASRDQGSITAVLGNHEGPTRRLQLRASSQTEASGWRSEKILSCCECAVTPKEVLMNDKIASNEEWLRWGKEDPLYGVAAWRGKEKGGASP
jgi:hypothetical protein